MKVNNRSDLNVAYEMLKFYREYGKDKNDKIRNLKREIRKFLNKPVSDKRIVHDDGIDGYIVLFPLPESIKTMEDAVEYFEEYEYIHCVYSAYDCIGRSFTHWYKLFKRNNRFYAYHSIGFDV